jgi:molecular chaperone DnaK
MKDVLLLDIIPISLGVETLGGVMTKMIERGTTIPTRRTEIYTTAEDNQTTVEVHVLQGERDTASANRSLGRFRLEGIQPAPRSVPQIEVTFDVDANGILNVTAKDKATGKQQKVTISGATGLSDEEIKRMIKDAEEHRDEDKKRRELVDARNRLDGLIYQVEKSLDEHRDKLTPDVKGKVEPALAAAKGAMESQDIAALKKAAEDLAQAAAALAQAGVATSGADTAASAAPQSGGAAGDVIDAEFDDRSVN